MNLPPAASIAFLLASLAGSVSAGTRPNLQPAVGVPGAPPVSTPGPVRQAWLRFHQMNLCRDLDAVFAFNSRGVEVWCRVTSEGSLKQLADILEPLKKAYTVEIYATRVDREKKPFKLEDDDPLPSLAINAELNFYMRDPFTRNLGTTYDDPSVLYAGNESAEQKRRLKLFGDQILEWMRNIDRMARDLPSLAGLAFGADAPADTRAAARTACLDHARAVSKDAGRLIENLAHALPRGSHDAPAARPSVKGSLPAPYECALRVSEQARAAVLSVRRFLYPQAHTVNLTDLRESSMIGILKALQKAVTDLESRAH